jgi:lipoprotein-releasing system ATP-binding protein
VLEVRDLHKHYDAPGGALRILDGVSFTLEQGGALAVMGPSGCGKSTLLQILGALDTPTSGEVALDGVSPFKLDAAAQARFRNARVGFVFQDHCLLPQLNVFENVMTPLLVGEADPAAPGRARRLLDEVGLLTRLNHRPAELSGGEKQRAALARALVRQPALLLCDEPTGNLDEASAAAVADLLCQIRAEHKTSLVIVTHSAQLAARFPVLARLHAGKLEFNHA